MLISPWISKLLSNISLERSSILVKNQKCNFCNFKQANVFDINNNFDLNSTFEQLYIFKKIDVSKNLGLFLKNKLWDIHNIPNRIRSIQFINGISTIPYLQWNGLPNDIFYSRMHIYRFSYIFIYWKTFWITPFIKMELISKHLIIKESIYLNI